MQYKNKTTHCYSGVDVIIDTSGWLNIVLSLYNTLLDC